MATGLIGLQKLTVRTLFFLIIFLLAQNSYAAQKFNTFTGKFDITGETYGSTTLPASCKIGDMYVDTDADTNGSLYICVAADTWKEVDDDGGAGGSGAFDDSGDPVVLNTTSKNVEIGDTGVTLDAKVQIAGDADEVQLVIEAHSTQTDDVLVVQQDDETQVATISDAGLVSALVGFDCIGAVDCDIGSGDITDVTVTTDGGDLVIDGTTVTGDAGGLTITTATNGALTLDPGGSGLTTVNSGTGGVTISTDAGNADITLNAHGTGDIIASDTIMLDGGLLDATGAVDMDYGSADITDHTFITDSTGTAEIVLPAGSIDGTEILNDTVDSADYAAGSIDLEHMSSASVDSDNIVDNTIVAADIDETAVYTWSGANLLTGIHEVADDIDFDFGTDSDWSIQYDEAVDNQLIFLTPNTAAVATTDPMFEVLVGTTPTADQQVFGVAKGTQASNTPLLTVDEDGDVVAGASITSGGAVSGLTLGGETTDPCATLGEGSIFYNTTSNYMCYCDGTNDLKMNDNTTACF